MPRSKKAVFLCLATVAVLAAASLAYALIIRGPLLGGPMVQLPRTDSFVIVWEMREDRRTSARIQRREGEWSEPQKTACEGGRYEATFTGLNPGTFYAYEIRYTPVDPNVEPLAEGRTRTDPGRGGPFRFLAFGDSGSGYDQQYELGKLMAGYDADIAVHTGDVVYPNGKASHYPRKFYRPYEELLARTAFFPSLGNHDWDDYRGGPYFDQFTLPKNGPKDTIPERHYWFDFGDVRFPRIIDQLDLLEMQGGDKRDLREEERIVANEMIRQLQGEKPVLFVASRPHYVRFLIEAPRQLAEEGREFPESHLWLQTSIGQRHKHFILFGNNKPPWPEPELTPPSDAASPSRSAAAGTRRPA